MRDYEFRFFRDGAMAAVHVTSVDNDSAACDRARSYLAQGTEFDWVEVRCGFHFMQKIAPEREAAPAAAPPSQQ